MQALASGAVRWKVTVRDLPYVVARGLDGATTVSATAFAAEAVGIGVMATGGIGGIHFGGGDVSADLPQLARSRLTVVCSGPKHVADAAATIEWLETHGVQLVGYRTDRLPGFLARGRLPLEQVADDVAQVVELIRVRQALGTPGALVLCQDPPEAAAMDPEELGSWPPRARRRRDAACSARRGRRSSWTGCTAAPAGAAWSPTWPCWRPTPAWPGDRRRPGRRRLTAQGRRARSGQALASTTSPSTIRPSGTR